MARDRHIPQAAQQDEVRAEECTLHSATDAIFNGRQGGGGLWVVQFHIASRLHVQLPT
jgi:hypothetical protein